MDDVSTVPGCVYHARENRVGVRVRVRVRVRSVVMDDVSSVFGCVYRGLCVSWVVCIMRA